MKIGGIGKTNVDLTYSGLPRVIGEGEELYATGFEILLGGGYPATLAHLKRLGEEVRFVTYLGADTFSAFAKTEMEKVGVEVTNIYVGDGTPINVSTVMITPTDRSIATYTESYVENAESEQRAYDVLKDCDIILMEALEHLELYKKLKADGKILVLDTGWDDELGFGKYGEYIEIADYYTPNSKEAMRITGKGTPVEALKELSKHFIRAVVKVDKDGVLGYEDGNVISVGTIPEFKLKDSTGAGDNFLAGFVYGIANGLDFSETLLAGTITGGSSVTEIGCFRGQINKTQMLEYLREYRHLIN